MTQTFNTHILISEYYELESDGSEKQMNEELSKKVLFKLKLCKKENDKKGTSNLIYKNYTVFNIVFIQISIIVFSYDSK